MSELTKSIIGQIYLYVTVVDVSSQETSSVCCQQGSGNTGKLFYGPVETFQGVENPADFGTIGMSIEDLKDTGG